MLSIINFLYLRILKYARIEHELQLLKQLLFFTQTQIAFIDFPSSKVENTLSILANFKLKRGTSLEWREKGIALEGSWDGFVVLFNEMLELKVEGFPGGIRKSVPLDKKLFFVVSDFAVNDSDRNRLLNFPFVSLHKAQIL